MKTILLKDSFTQQNDHTMNAAFRQRLADFGKLFAAGLGRTAREET